MNPNRKKAFTLPHKAIANVGEAKNFRSDIVRLNVFPSKTRVKCTAKGNKNTVTTERSLNVGEVNNRRSSRSVSRGTDCSNDPGVSKFKSRGRRGVASKRKIQSEMDSHFNQINCSF